MSRIEDYVGAVMGHVPRAYAERGQIELDLRSHLLDLVEAGESEEAAVARMGPPEDVARGYLADLPLEYASRLRRSGAFLVDMALGVVVLTPLLLLLHRLLLGADVPWDPVPTVAVFVFLAAIGLAAPVMGLLYFLPMEAVYGRTLGKWLLGMCVVRDSGTRMRWGAAFLRRIPFYFDIFWLDAIFALFTQKRQRAFDLVAGTVVVRCDRQARTPRAGAALAA
jgi:uncharacterized RDD family membrane protein YckC